MTVGGITGEVARDLTVAQDNYAAACHIPEIRCHLTVGDGIADNRLPVEIQAEETDGLIGQGGRIHKGILEDTTVSVDGAADLSVGRIPEVGVYHGDHATSGLVHIFNHVGRGLAAADYIGIQIIRHSHLHFHARRIQFDAQDENMLHFCQ